MLDTILPETLLLVVLRSLLFFSCRKYLLRSLYSDLQSLSTDSHTLSIPSTPRDERSESNGGPVMELDTLPVPSTTPKPTGFAIADTSFLHSAISRTIFAWTWAESCTMFLLLMFQGLDFLSPDTRLLNWMFSLYFLMTVILLLIPLCVSLLLALGSGDQTRRRLFLGPRILFSFVPFILYLLGLSYIPLPAALSESDSATSALAQLIVLGTIILGLLSGFGAVSSAWRFLPFVVRNWNVPTDQDVDASQYALSSIRNDLRDRRLEVERRSGNVAEGSWMSRVGSSIRGGDSLSQELRGLEALEYQMARNVEALRERRDRAKFSGTLKGKLFNLCGRLFASYCVIRVLNCIYNVAYLPSQRKTSTTTYPDLISELLAYAVTWFSPNKVDFTDVVNFSSQLSLILVGLIILSSMRLVLRGVARALRVSSRNLGASLMLLLLSQLMGIYLLSTVVQLRSSFPPLPTRPEEDPVVTNLFATIPEYGVFGSLFDWSFLIAAGISGFVRWGAERVNH